MLARLFSFLEVDASRVPEPLQVTSKQTRKELPPHIINYDELFYAFQHTRVGPSLPPKAS